MPADHVSWRLDVVPIDATARDGRHQLVVADYFALARWGEDRWHYPSGAPLDFEPTHYHPRKD